MPECRRSVIAQSVRCAHGIYRLFSWRIHVLRLSSGRLPAAGRALLSSCFYRALCACDVRQFCLVAALCNIVQLYLFAVKTFFYYVHVETTAHGKPYQFGVKFIFACRLYRLALALQQGAQHGDVFFGVNLTERA